MSKLFALLLLFLVVQHSVQVPDDDDDKDKKAQKCGKGGKNTGKGFKELIKCKGFKDKAVKEDAKALKDDPAAKEFLACAMKAFGVLDKDGVPQKEVMKHYLCRKGKTEAEAEELVNKCAKKGDSEPDTAYAIAKCFDENGIKIGSGGGKKGGKKGGGKKAEDDK